jgi:hypothetical protein
LMTTRCPPAWRALPALQSALAAAWRDLGREGDTRVAGAPWVEVSAAAAGLRKLKGPAGEA